MIAAVSKCNNGVIDAAMSKWTTFVCIGWSSSVLAVTNYTELESKFKILVLGFTLLALAPVVITRWVRLLRELKDGRQRDQDV